MSSFYGADVGQLRALGRDLSASAEQLDLILARLGGRVDDVAWYGPDAERFRGDWHAAHARAMRLVAGALRDAAAAAAANAAQQESTSGGGSFGGGVGWIPGFAPVPGAPIVPDDLARDMEYGEGRDWVLSDGKPLDVRGRYDEGGAHIEVGDRRIYEGDADWPPITPREGVTGAFVPDSTNG